MNFVTASGVKNAPRSFLTSGVSQGDTSGASDMTPLSQLRLTNGATATHFGPSPAHAQFLIH